jgi:hypothetical protein
MVLPRRESRSLPGIQNTAHHAKYPFLTQQTKPAASGPRLLKTPSASWGFFDSFTPCRRRPCQTAANRRQDRCAGGHSRVSADDRSDQARLVIADQPPTALRRSWLAQHHASPVLGNVHLRADMIDAVPAAGRAEYFPSRASFRISVSSVSSETTLRNRSFSRSR